jgi:RimJ/RimL family protein N-acetyltransferase
MTVLLETERLSLRAFTPDDVDHLYELNADRDVMWLLNGGEPTPRAEVRDRIIPFFLGFYERHGFGGPGFWATEAKGTGEFLGWFHLRPDEAGGVDLGYRLRKAAWNKGYATEGGLALVRWSFTRMGAPRVFAHTMCANSASRRVMDKCGLTFTRTIHGSDLPAIPGAEQGEVEYARTRDEWLAAGG